MSKNLNVKSGGLRSIVNILISLKKLTTVISISFVILLLTGINSVVESIDQKSAMPFVKHVGGKILYHDQQLYSDSLEIEKHGGLLVESQNTGFLEKVKHGWGILKKFGSVFVNLWYLWLFAVIFYNLSSYITDNTSAKRTNIFLCILFLIVLQILANFIAVDENNIQISTKEKLIPFKGLFNFAKTVPLLFQSKIIELDTQKNTVFDNTTTNSNNQFLDDEIATINMVGGAI